MSKECKFKVGQKVIILDKTKESGKYYNQTGVVEFSEYFSKNHYYSIRCDDDNLNNSYIYRGKQRHDSDRFWREDKIRLANKNKRI